LIAISLNEEDELATVRLTDGNSEIIIATRKGMAIRLDETQIRPLSRTARGVRAIKLRGDDEVVSMARVREGSYLMTVSTKGQGRRTDLEDYRLQNRGGFGMINYKPSDVKGEVAGVKVVDVNDDLILIADDGIIIRIRVSDINVMSRYAGGVRVMRLSPEAKVVTFARADHDEEEEIATVEEIAEEDVNIEELEAFEKELEKEDSSLDLEEEESETEE